MKSSTLGDPSNLNSKYIDLNEGETQSQDECQLPHQKDVLLTWNNYCLITILSLKRVNFNHVHEHVAVSLESQKFLSLRKLDFAYI